MVPWFHSTFPSYLFIVRCCTLCKCFSCAKGIFSRLKILFLVCQKCECHEHSASSLKSVMSVSLPCKSWKNILCHKTWESEKPEADSGFALYMLSIWKNLVTDNTVTCLLRSHPASHQFQYVWLVCCVYVCVFLCIWLLPLCTASVFSFFCWFQLVYAVSCRMNAIIC